MVIDDNPAMQKVLRIHLESSGYIAQVAENGNHALKILKDGKFHPDCILLDIKMPDITGLQLLPMVKSGFPLVPVVMLTAQTDLETGLEAMRSGAFDFLTKPVRKDGLLETIKKALGYREILLENDRLTKENREYQQNLEKMVEERSGELMNAYKMLKETNLSTVRVLAETIEAKDPYTRGHCNRVRVLSRETAILLGMKEQTIESLEYSALLHDIGKIAIPINLLHKTGSLDPDERMKFEDHPGIGENILKVVDFFAPCLNIVRHHHERWDGLGYPDGIAGDSIELPTRIVQITDAFDAMTSNRPYREALPRESALKELYEGKGTQFNPDIVDVFIDKKVYLSIENLN